LKKELDRIAGPNLYKEGCAYTQIAHREEKLSMLTSWTHKEHIAKRQPAAAMRGVCLMGSLSSSVNIFYGRLGQTSIDSRHIRH
jgi:hypothetical protein